MEGSQICIAKSSKKEHHIAGIGILITKSPNKGSFFSRENYISYNETELYIHLKENNYA